MPNAWQDNQLFTHYKVSTISGDPLETVAGLSVPQHDYIGMTYSGTDLTGVVYKTGGSSGTTVATLVLTYDGSSNLTSVTKS
jgi:hypothetical protein